MLRFRMFAIACGYEVADDCDALRGDPLFKLVVGRAPESGRDLCSQPTMSRLENGPSRIKVALRTATPVDILPLLPGPAGGDHAGHRRHLRRGTWASAAVDVQRPLRHPVLPAGTCLPCRQRQAGGGSTKRLCGDTGAWIRRAKSLPAKAPEAPVSVSNDEPEWRAGRPPPCVPAPKPERLSSAVSRRIVTA